MIANKKEFPNEIYIYICDRDNNTPIFAATMLLEDIDNRELVGCYKRIDVKTMAVTKELI